MMTDREKIGVIQAKMAGSQIQFKANDGDGQWIDVPTPTWGFDDGDFRVKPSPPTPRDIYVPVNADTSLEPLYKFTQSEANAISPIGISAHFQEIL